MDALILSCGTGGGHNAAARAVQEELLRRGHRAELMNPYILRGQRTVKRVDNIYVSMVQRAPKAFGLVYKAGDLYRRLPWRSPVYHFNRKTAKALGAFLQKSPFDVIVLTHIYPGEGLTILKNRGVTTPPILFVSTDYTCSPFVEEIAADAWVIPHPDLAAEYAARGIPAHKLHPLGIPVSAAFAQTVPQAEARKALGLDPNGRYYLISAGSMGAGVLKKAVKRLVAHCENGERLIVICGTNHRLYKYLEKKYGHKLTLLHTTDQMALYLHACDLYLTKPGGLSSTEAAVAGVPLVHLPPIPGCETLNAHFFAKLDLTVPPDQFDHATDLAHEVIAHQHAQIPSDSAQRICDLAEQMAQKPTHTA